MTRLPSDITVMVALAMAVVLGMALWGIIIAMGVLFWRMCCA